jgi:repressor LexA
VLGNVAAGIPLDAITDVEDYEEISEAMAAGGEYVALRIHGDSMSPRMVEGDVVIVHVQSSANDGDIVIALIDGEDGTVRATCKKLRITPQGIMLLSFHPDYEPMLYTSERLKATPLRIFGRVVELRAKFDR